MTPNAAYNAEGKCPKCGGVEVSTVYVAARPYWVVSFDPTLPEHLQRICQRCKYAWAERTVDGEEGEAVIDA